LPILIKLGGFLKSLATARASPKVTTNGPMPIGLELPCMCCRLLGALTVGHKCPPPCPNPVDSLGFPPKPPIVDDSDWLLSMSLPPQAIQMRAWRKASKEEEDRENSSQRSIINYHCNSFLEGNITL
jgi:hypothetical protein